MQPEDSDDFEEVSEEDEEDDSDEASEEAQVKGGHHRLSSNKFKDEAVEYDSDLDNTMMTKYQNQSM